MTAAVSRSAINSGEFDAARLERVFAHCFGESHATRLEGGADEPVYLPAEDGRPAVIRYRADYFASALHEVAHWCIAGRARRQRVDFGYWYAPEGRNPQQQRAFEAVEAGPQALEWLFSLACGYRFRLSADNLDSHSGQLPDNQAFARQVLARALHWQRRGPPQRAACFCEALRVEFRTDPGHPALELGLAELLE